MKSVRAVSPSENKEIKPSQSSFDQLFASYIPHLKAQLDKQANTTAEEEKAAAKRWYIQQLRVGAEQLKEQLDRYTKATGDSVIQDHHALLLVMLNENMQYKAQLEKYTHVTVDEEKERVEYIQHLKEQLDRYANATPSSTISEHETLMAMLNKGMQYPSLKSILTQAKSQLSRDTILGLPGEVLQLVGQMVDPKGVIALSQLSVKHHVLFKQHTLPNTLLKAIDKCDHKQVEEILEQAENMDRFGFFKKMLLQKHCFTDSNGHQFKDITLFQLALWNLDGYLCRLLLIYMERCHLERTAKKQFEDHDKGKLQYVNEYGKHHDFESHAQKEKYESLKIELGEKLLRMSNSAMSREMRF